MPHTCRVLVVDDMPDTARTLAALVVAIGHTAEYVTDPRLAVDHAKRFQPELVLLDIGMPHINGYELAPMLRAAVAPRRISIVAVTAWGSQQDRDHSKAAGFEEHLRKPAQMPVIESVIERFCAPR